MDQQGEFFFLEVNTRLQVEHPVTEMITGLDLVRMQLLVAQGEPLPDDAVVATINGHSIEARLYAEDVAAGFLPASGPVDRLRVTLTDGVRVDAGFEDGSVVSTFYDAMLAKVIAWGPTRTDAARRLAEALATAQVHGVTTNRDLLVRVLRHPEFLDGRTDTGFLQRHDPVELSAPSADDVGAPAARGRGRAGGPGRAAGVGARARAPAVGLAQRAVGARDRTVRGRRRHGEGRLRDLRCTHGRGRDRRRSRHAHRHRAARRERGAGRARGRRRAPALRRPARRRHVVRRQPARRVRRSTSSRASRCRRCTPRPGRSSRRCRAPSCGSRPRSVTGSRPARRSSSSRR